MNALWALPVICSTLTAADPLPDGSYLSIHHQELVAHGQDRIAPRIVPTPEQLAHGSMKTVNRIVYGYYPYWMHDLTTIRWSALTHLAWFAVEMDQLGNVTDDHGWPDPDAVSTAHAASVRVDLAFTLFSGSGILALCQDEGRRGTAIGNMVDLMVEGGADGIAVDFEGLVDDTRDYFTQFIRELRAELDARGLATAEISIAGPAVDWGGEFDIPALLDVIDSYFIMGYDLFWSGSGNAGPTGLLRVTPDWRPVTSLSMLRSIAYYTSQGPAHLRRKIVYGVPYYGREWTTTSSAMGAATIANQRAVSYAAARADLAGGMERLWHDGVKNPWYVWQEGGTWHQVYYDDEESLSAKYDLALDQDLGGVGMWALNHDSGYTELWDLLEAKFGAEPATPPGHRANPIPIDAFPFHDEQDTTVGPSRYFNYYACNPALAEYGREFVYVLDTCQAGTVTASVPEYASQDPDVHLLGALDQDACLARAHLDLTAPVTPGRYYLTVDTYVDDSVELEGPYTLDVDFAPDPGSEPCAGHLVCSEGTCLCPEAGLTDCGTACVDLLVDVANCGTCGHACDPGQRCDQGGCATGPGPDAGVSPDGSVTSPDAASPVDAGDATPPTGGGSGCDCAAGGDTPPAGLLILLVFALLVFVRRRRG